MQQTLAGCAFCDAVPGRDVGEAHTWGKDERVTEVQGGSPRLQPWEESDSKQTTSDSTPTPPRKS